MNQKSFQQSNFTNIPDPNLPLTKVWHGSIVSRFMQHVSPKLAIETPEESWRYDELHSASLYVSQRILIHIIPGEPRWGRPVVAVYAKRTAALVVSLLGILRAGYAFLVLDPSYPGRRLAKCVNLAGPVGLLNIGGQTLTRDLKNAMDFSGPSFYMDVPEKKSELLSWFRCEGQAYIDEQQVTLPDDLLYVAFTSGTTGSPKAIIGSHCPVSHFFEWQQKTFGLTEKDRVSFLSGLAHDPMLRDVLMPLWTGATICVPPQGCYEMPGRLYEWMIENRVSTAHLTPGLGQLMLTHDIGRASGKLCDLRYAFFGGDVLRYQLVRRLAECAPNVTVVNCYGTTETPQVVGFHVLKPDGSQNSASVQSSGSVVPIGKGIDNSQLLVLDDSGHICKEGEFGEIFVRSPYLAKEIVDETGPCHNAIILNPYTLLDSDQLYKTGDIGCYLNDGSVLFRGRNDRQLKLRGFRIELGEIDKVVAEQEWILGHYIDIEGENDDEKRIVLYIARNVDTKNGPDDVRELLLENLPKFMVPDRIIDVPQIPLTPNGKIDRAKLREIGRWRKRFSSPGSGGTSHDIETELTRALSNVINDPDIDLDDSILQIGIDSLQAISFCCEIQKAFDVNLGTAEIFDQGTIRSLANYIASCRLTLGGDRALSLGAGGNSLPYSKSSGIDDQQTVSSAAVTGTVAAGGIPGETHGPKLFPKNENIFIGIRNRILQIIARLAPDVLRVKLHRIRGVQIGNNVSIGYDSVIETSYPWLVRLADNVNIGMRTTIIAHFRGMVPVSKGEFTVDIQNGAFVGPGVIILPKVTIGEGAVVAAGSVVTKSVPPYTLVQGNPAIPMARCGVALTGKTRYDDFIRKLTPIKRVD